MDKLVTDMLQYNRIATNGNVNIEKCNLSDIVKAEVEKYKKQFELHEKNITLNIFDIISTCLLCLLFLAFCVLQDEYHLLLLSKIGNRSFYRFW